MTDPENGEPRYVEEAYIGDSRTRIRELTEQETETLEITYPAD